MERHLGLVLEDEWRATAGELESALRREGLADAQILPRIFLGGDRAALMAELERFSAQVARDRGMTHVGVAIRHAKGTHAVAALFSRRILELTPLAKHVREGTFLLRGRARGLTGLEVLLLGPCDPGLLVCAVETRRVAHRLEGDVLSAPIDVTGAGRYVLEVVATRDRGPEVAAYWTFTVGAPLSTNTEPSELRPRVPPKSIQELVNAERTQRTLAPLAPNAALAQAARAQAEEVCRTLIAAHVTSATQDPASRARRAGYAGAVSENIAIAPSVERAHMNLLRSPSHRANLLDPIAEEVGYAVVKRTAGDETSYCVVEVFGRAPPPR